jgi:DNA invertase Pin-like site-specific DNA recombinase
MSIKNNESGKPTKQKTVAIYARASMRSRQYDLYGETSTMRIEEQRRTCANHARAELGTNHHECFADVENGTRHMTARPGFRDLLHHLRHHHTDYLVVATRDRLTRDHTEYLLLELALKTLGTKIVVAKETKLEKEINERMTHFLNNERE